MRNTRKDFEQRRLARTISTDDAHNFARKHLEINVLQRPESFLLPAEAF